MKQNDMIRIAVQKSGRLSEKSTALLRQCGIHFSNGSNKLKTQASNFPLEVLYLRDDDIPQYVHEGVADLGIVGENVVKEKQRHLDILEPLGFGKCRISLAVRNEAQYSGLTWLNGRRIATSYPVLLSTYLKDNDVQAEIEEITGSVEIAPGIGLADAICDIVSTGSTLLSNGLKEVEVIDNSEAILIATPAPSEAKSLLIEQLLFRIRSVQTAGRNKYILLNAPNDAVAQITSILPGMRSPTVIPLAEEGWSSMHSVVSEDRFWSVIEKLRNAGAEGILVCPIEKMIV